MSAFDPFLHSDARRGIVRQAICTMLGECRYGELKGNLTEDA
jgi:hypothetical protein